MTTMSRGFIVLISAGTLLGAACHHAPASPPAPEARKEVTVPDAEAARINAMAARFAPVDITVDLTAVPAREQQALARLVDAARIMDTLFLRQVWAGNETLLLDLIKDTSPAGVARLHYFLINKGPWSRLDRNEPFVLGTPPKPAEANFYPAGATKGEIEAWLRRLSEAERQRATGFFTTIRRAAGGLVAVPYSLEYQGELAWAAALLREAGGLTAQPTLKAFLTARAHAFISNDYYPSDLAWMALDSSIEPTIGPYEVYEDDWFNAKAAFEAFIAVRDEVESQKVERFGAERQGIEDHLPIDPKYRNPKVGGLTPIRVVDVIFSAGDGNRGVQTIAYNLPNDDRVVKEKGTKNVMLANFQAAKFKVVLVPISEIVLASGDRRDVTFDAFFSHTLMHELMHGLGPHQISVGGRATTVRQELKETFSSIEEAKADVSGLFALQYLIDKGTLDRSTERAVYRTFLASAFRAIRFGLSEAHGRSIAVQLNTFLDRGAFVVQPDGTFSVNDERMKDAVTQLTRDLMTIEAEGNYAKAKELLQRLALIRPEVEAVLGRLTLVPVDIEPRFVTAVGLAKAQTK